MFEFCHNIHPVNLTTGRLGS